MVVSLDNKWLEDDVNNTWIAALVCILSIGCNNGDSIPVPIEGPGGITAAYSMARVDLLANSLDKGLRLMVVRSEEVNCDGTSAIWYYEYIGTAETMPPPTYCFHATYFSVAFDSNSILKVGAAVITHSWFNSNEALNIAEKNGGSNFRAQNPNCTIEACLGQPVVPNAITSWCVTYHSKTDNSKLLSLIIDANTGAITSKYP